jgi:hypothetical protein
MVAPLDADGMGEVHRARNTKLQRDAAIYGLDESGDTPFLALELVEGRDLTERIKRGGPRGSTRSS